MKPRAAVILIQDAKIAMIERYRAGMHYVVFPGGKIESGESPEGAAQREVKEELGLDVTIGKMVAELWYQGTPQYYYLAEQIAGVFGSGAGKEMASPSSSPKGSHHPIWLPLDGMLGHPVLPKLMAELVVNSYPDRWPDQPLVVKENPSEDLS